LREGGEVMGNKGVGGGIFEVCERATMDEGTHMAILDWSQCQAVESVADRRSGAWVFRDTRTPVSVVFDNLEAGASISEIMEWFHLSREQIAAVMDFAARSLDLPAVTPSAPLVDAHTI